MDLSLETVETLAAEYATSQPLAMVENEHLEMLPSTLASGSYGWRDPEWIIQWYFRRFLGRYPDAERRAIEDAFGENAFDDVRTALAETVETESTATNLEILTELTGVDVSVATAFLQFLDPETYMVMSEREWNALWRFGELPAMYPPQPSPADYERYLQTCRIVADRCTCNLQTLYRALWMIEAGELG